MNQTLNSAQRAALLAMNSALSQATDCDLLAPLKHTYCANAAAINDVCDAAARCAADNGSGNGNGNAGYASTEDDDIAQVLTALADVLAGYPERELAAGWRAAAARVATRLRDAGVEDEGTWDAFTPTHPDAT